MLVRAFETIGLGDTPSVGGKGANLGELVRAGICVPPGAVVTTDAFERFLSSVDSAGALRRAIEKLDSTDLNAIARASEETKTVIEGADLPADIESAIWAAHRELCGADDATFAVRSSATSEDSEDASFAGLQDTYLWLRGADSVSHHVRKCWASLYSTESIAYRRRLRLPEEGLAMGVVIQRMVNSLASGVMFTRSPATGDRSVIVIEASYGLGSAIVSGEVTPDKFVVNKVSGEIADRAISTKLMQHVPDLTLGGVRDIAVPDDLQNVACVSDAKLAELVQIGRAVERHYGRPQDIEWAISRGEETVFLLQARPETVWAKRDAEPVAKPRASALDHVFAAFGGNR